MGGEMRRQKSLRIGIHHANAVVRGPVYRTHLRVPDQHPRGAASARGVRRRAEVPHRAHAVVAAGV
eukprot:30409-Pelagococcus_subviridis.AAC.4